MIKILCISQAIHLLFLLYYRTVVLDEQTVNRPLHKCFIECPGK